MARCALKTTWLYCNQNATVTVHGNVLFVRYRIHVTVRRRRCASAAIRMAAAAVRGESFLVEDGAVGGEDLRP
jgi:hypothetical protein